MSQLDFDDIDVDPVVIPFIVKEPSAFTGKWQEDAKPEMVMEMLARLGLNAFKRRLVYRTSNTLHFKLTSLQKDEVTADEARAPMDEGSEVGSTAPASPSTYGRSHIWLQEQSFPLGRMLKAEFWDDGKTEVLIEDSETGAWAQKALWRNGRLLQMRHSDKLKCTMCDIRCVLSLSKEELISLGMKTDTNEDRYKRLYFKWVIIDDDDPTKSISCSYFMKPCSV